MGLCLKRNIGVRFPKSKKKAITKGKGEKNTNTAKRQITYVSTGGHKSIGAFEKKTQ